MYNKTMSGKDLATLADDISKEDIPVLQTSYQNMCQNECLDALNESETQFTQGLDTIKLPVEHDKEFEEWMSKLEAVAIENYNVRCDKIEIKNDFLERLKTRIDDRKKNKRQENQNMRAEKALTEMADSIEKQKIHMAEIE